ncbi:MAG: hypothetical protein QOF76_598 [Solirubrobacteraceae bacterium]|jgi:hypothetical protein|nr:hypothetical protein [Solirubrobacteraceae bacterium]
MKVLFKPISIVIGLLAGFLSKKIFNQIWMAIDDEKMPKATHEEVPLGKVVAAAALQGVVFKATRAAVERYGANGFYKVTGSWPGDKRPEPQPDKF